MSFPSVCFLEEVNNLRTECVLLSSTGWPFSSNINPGDNETDSQETDVYNNISSLTTQTTSPHSLMLNKWLSSEVKDQPKGLANKC